MNFKNMKIPVENNLDEIVGELERLGYKLNGWLKNRIIRSVKTNHFGLYSGDFFDVDIIQGELTTLAELKEV
ncbi:MAG: hypothetical protein RSE18_12455 [Acinetobacter sp.]